MQYNGILPLFKPKGLTSHDCVYRMRKLLKMKRIGHTGTLDPNVTGVLPLCLGRATKVAEYMSDYPKKYIAEVTLGYSTTTEDATGEIVAEKAVTIAITKAEIEKVFTKFTGKIIQIAPLYSAVKVKGKRLYEYARAGIDVERPRREVTIEYLKLVNEKIEHKNSFVRFTFEVSCSKGTYIRTLAVDIGKALGFPAHMSSLQRIASGPFTLKDCYTFEEIEKFIETGSLEKRIVPLETAISHLKKVTVCHELEQKILHGAVLPKFKEVDEKRISLYNKHGECLAIYKEHPTKANLIKPEKMISAKTN